MMFALVALLAAAASYAEEGFGCSADSYAAVFAPWTDQAQSPQLWIVPESGAPHMVRIAGPIKRMVCTRDTVLLQGPAGVASVPVSTSASSVVFDASRSWAPAGNEQVRSFKLNKARIIAFGRTQHRQVVVARATGSGDGEPQEFTAVLIAEVPQSTDAPQMLFSTTMVTITVD